MSPTSNSSSAIYDHLVINFPPKQQTSSKLLMRNSSKKDLSNNIYDNSTRYFQSNSTTDCNHLLSMKKTQSLPADDQQRTKRRCTLTQMTVQEPTVRCSVSNQAYEKPISCKPSSTSINSSSSSYKDSHRDSKYFQSPISSHIEIKSMDFRPLITNGRRRFSTISSSSPMVVIKKKSPSPMNTISFGQKPLFRSIPVNITSNNPAMLVSTVIPSSLSYSSCCSSSATSTCSANVKTVTVPIQVIKTEKKKNNNNNNNNSISTSTSASTITTLVGSKKGYRYAPKHSEQSRPLFNLKAGNQIQPLPFLSDDDDNESTKIPSSSSGSGDGYYNSNSTLMADSNVLRLIRRYDPTAVDAVSIRPRRSLENTRSAFNVDSSKPQALFPSNISSASCSYLAERPLNSIRDDNRTVKQISTPRLQKQKTMPEQDTLPSVISSAQPILKYTPPPSTISRTDRNLDTKKTEPLTIEIEPHIQLPTSYANQTNYQPLITTAQKRVCSAISKSEWDLRLQQDLPSPVMPTISQSSSTTTAATSSALPIQTPSTKITNTQSQTKSSYRPLLGRSKSIMVLNNDQDNDLDDFDENSAPLTPNTCVNKLKQMFNSKTNDFSSTSLKKTDRINSTESNLNRPLQTNGNTSNQSDLSSSTYPSNKKAPSTNSADLQTRTISNVNLTKPTTLVQQSVPTASPLLKRPILKSQKTLDSPESLNRLNNNSTMPSSELSYDTYRFRRLNDTDKVTSSMPAARLRNVAKVEPYSINTNMVRPLYQSSQPTSTTRIHLNSTGNTPTNSSTSSSVASLGNTIRHPNIRQSDFLIPNPGYSKTSSQPQSQAMSNSSSYTTPPSTSALLSESLSNLSTHRLPHTTNNSLYNGRSTGLTSSTIKPSPPKNQSSLNNEFYSNQQIYPSSLKYSNGNNKSPVNQYTPVNSYHYRPKEFAASTTAINIPSNNGRQQSYGEFVRATTVEKQSLQNPIQADERMSLTQQPRRRFQRRKQMKRSKSVDLYQEPSLTSSKSSNPSSYRYSTAQDNHDFNRQQRSISRDFNGAGDGHQSSSSSASSSMSNLERINRAALLRYKSLDSMTFNNKKSNLNGKNPLRKQSSRPISIDYDSDDSVCGIPKPRKNYGR